MPNLLTPWITPLRINATPVSFMVLSSQWQAFEGAQPKLPRDGSCSSTKLMLSNTTRKASSTILPRCRAGKWALRLRSAATCSWLAHRILRGKDIPDPITRNEKKAVRVDYATSGAYICD
eukprot:scaffold158499_cov34-Tisochrysis_lutea.AAC.3